MAVLPSRSADIIVIGETRDGRPLMLNSANPAINAKFLDGDYRKYLEAAVEQVAHDRPDFRHRFSAVATIDSPIFAGPVFQDKNHMLERVWHEAIMNRTGEKVIVPVVTPPRNKSQLTLVFRGQYVAGVNLGVRPSRRFPTGGSDEARLRQDWRDQGLVLEHPVEWLKIQPLAKNPKDRPTAPAWFDAACRNFSL